MPDIVPDSNYARADVSATEREDGAGSDFEMCAAQVYNQRRRRARAPSQTRHRPLDLDDRTSVPPWRQPFRAQLISLIPPASTTLACAGQACARGEQRVCASVAAQNSEMRTCTRTHTSKTRQRVVKSAARYCFLSPTGVDFSSGVGHSSCLVSLPPAGLPTKTNTLEPSRVSSQPGFVANRLLGGRSEERNPLVAPAISPPTARSTSPSVPPTPPSYVLLTHAQPAECFTLHLGECHTPMGLKVSSQSSQRDTLCPYVRPTIVTYKLKCTVQHVLDARPLRRALMPLAALHPLQSPDVFVGIKRWASCYPLSRGCRVHLFTDIACPLPMNATCRTASRRVLAAVFAHRVLSPPRVPALVLARPEHPYISHRGTQKLTSPKTLTLCYCQQSEQPCAAAFPWHTSTHTASCSLLRPLLCAPFCVPPLAPAFHMRCAAGSNVLNGIGMNPRSARPAAPCTHLHTRPQRPRSMLSPTGALPIAATRRPRPPPRAPLIRARTLVSQKPQVRVWPASVVMRYGRTGRVRPHVHVFPNAFKCKHEAKAAGTQRGMDGHGPCRLSPPPTLSSWAGSFTDAASSSGSR
ncbi:hypothetical protein EVG20_g5485 [Dentipellis fragilis]|uniref:Uncharacterized protein n=1 Tax=Dentipellis fragilis TaxID=205917 RepID=A0A4Y9YWU8_9AGAM|nr:hypothetical protein EVG20_g5485 [Dentipellis fragilis]